MRDDFSYSKCSCGYNEDQLRYCEVSPGDPPYEKARQIFLRVLVKNAMCYTAQRFHIKCEAISQDIKDILTLQMYAENAHKFYDAPKCVVELGASY